MNELNTISLPDFTRLAEIFWAKMRDSVPAIARTSGLFDVSAIPLGTGETRDFNEVDKELYAREKGQGEQASRMRVQQGYSKTMRVRRKSLDVGITVEWRKYGKYPQVKAALTSLGTLVPNRQELDLQHRVTFMTATSYTDMDGISVDITLGDTLALLSTAHTVRGASTTYRNRLANNPQFSRGALEGMELLVAENSINQFGQKIAQPMDIIWTTDDPNTCNAVRELLTSTSAPDALNSGVTAVYKGKYRHIVLPLVATDKDGLVDTTKRKYWGLASSVNTQAHLGIWEEAYLKSPAAEGKNAEDFSTENWEYGTAGAYGICIVAGYWFFGSTGDGTA